MAFHNRLDPEDSPESVHLQKNDIILVRRRVVAIAVPLPMITNDTYVADMRQLFLNGEGSDVVFEVGPEKATLRAHRLILRARCEIFHAMFRPGAMRESEDGRVCIEDHAPDMVAKMLEFIYTNNVTDLNNLNATQLIDLLTLAEQYLLQPLKHLCEVAARDVLTIANVGRFLCAAEKHNAAYLKDFALNFFTENTQDVVEDENFRDELEACPSLALTLVRALNRGNGQVADLSNKRRRLNMPEETEF